MDRLTSGFDRLHLARHGKEEEWKTVGSSSKRSQESLTSHHNQMKMDPLIISHNCPFSIFQMPKFHTDESVLRLVNSVANTGPETMRLLLEITLETYPKQLVVLRGVPGSGKSSVASALMATTRKGTICSADDYFMDSKGNYNFNPGRLRDAHESSQLKCRKLMEKETSPVIIDNTNTRRFEMEPYVRMAIENNYAINVFEPETSWKNDARVLAQKNAHGVPRGKIQEMIDRFEQILPYLVVEDVRKRMGEVGKRYNPVRADFGDPNNQHPPPPGLLFPAGHTPPPLVGATKLETHIPPLMTLNLREEYPGPPNMATPPPTPLLCEYVMNSLGSPATSRSRGKMKRKTKAAAATVGGAGARMTDNFQENPTATGGKFSIPYSESLLKSAEKLHAYFPTYKINDLADLLEKHDGDINEAMNALLDSGYSVAEEVVLLEEAAPQAPLNNNDLSSLVPAQPDQIHSNSVISGPSAYNPTNGTIGVEDNTEHLTVNYGQDDWFDVKLPHEFVKRLALMFGQPGDPNIQAMLANPDGFNTRLPPELGFKMYRKLVRNAEAKACKEAEEAAKD